MYHWLIVLSVIMFGGSFFVKDIYRRKRTANDFVLTFESMFIGSIAGLIILFCINGLKFEFTPFTLVMVLLTTLNNLAFTFCSFKALRHINLSIFSLFTMLGGMLLPFFQGIIFYDEKITLGKVICVILIFVSLSLTIKKENKKSGFIYYLGIFTFNGLSGVLSKIFTESNYEKTSPAGYSIFLAIISILIAGIALLILQKKKEKTQNKSSLICASLCALNGVLDKIANYILVFALLYVDASVQYPMVTGGVMIVSTICSYFIGVKPTKKEILSVLIAFIGLLMLFIL